MIAAAISIIVTFILAYFLGIDEETSTVNLEKVAPGISSRKMSSLRFQVKFSL